MTYSQALAAAKSGALIKRPHWDNPLRYNGRALEFVTAVQTWGNNFDRSYPSWQPDNLASDWECAAVANVQARAA